jgi:hypothetical protein
MRVAGGGLRANRILERRWLRMEKSTSSLDSAIASLKEIVTIVNALTIANATALVMKTILTGKTVTSQSYDLNHVQAVPVALYLVLVFTVIRFYHGNVRHLDKSYAHTDGSPAEELSAGKTSFSVAADFAVILAESIGFSIASFFMVSPREFSLAFAAILTLDVIWFFFVQQIRSDDERYAKVWAANNLVTLAVLYLLVLWTRGWKLQSFEKIAFWFIVGVMVVNFAVDIAINWTFYFPSGRLPVPGQAAGIAGTSEPPGDH